MFCHHEHFTSADGLVQLYKIWLRWKKFQKHRRKNLLGVKTGQNWLNKQKCIFLVKHLS